MKKRIERIESESKVKMVYRIYFWEFVAYATLCIMAINWYLNKDNDFQNIAFLICLGFDKVLDGKDELIKFTRVKDKI